MSNDSSLVVRHSSHSVIARDASSQPAGDMHILPRGPGRTLYEIYASLGSAAEASANRAAHILGLGPLAVAARIAAYFGEQHDRERKVKELGNTPSRRLQRDCSRLMAYALPSETAATQMNAFKGIIDLTTQYPGLRRLFLNGRYVRGLELSEAALSLLWDRDFCGPEWHFFRHFAAACLADSDISLMLEASPQWTCVDNVRGLSVVERLVVAADCEGPSDFSPFIAIRYLGGILELQSFWLQTGCIYEAAVNKISAKAALFLKDIGIDSLEDEETGPSDIGGTDNLCKALLQGTQAWMVGREDADLKGEFWYDALL
ncbi:hypothetical protein B0H19DRAFT_1267682 [Mycena capillaripes]|nr:hypothetical protein B0H19DRAFT_1267682 [Mycena capillaripes]